VTHTPKLRILSLGAGVQSSTLALMIARGDLPMVDCAIFADTGAEPKSVYTYLEYLRSLNLPFPIYDVSQGNLRDALNIGLTTGKRYSSIPFYTLQDGEKGMAPRQCTLDYKIAPVRRKVRELHGGKVPKKPVEMLIGISTDEMLRMTMSKVKYITHKYPLIEAGMSRRDCVKYMEERQYKTPPKSACTFCPFRSDTGWAHMRDNDPESWAEAVSVDRALRANDSTKRMKAQMFLHKELIPLDAVKLSPEEWGQTDMFNNDCQGMCGV
jgi:hypothetical protein